jgi:hypothetical protein
MTDLERLVQNYLVLRRGMGFVLRSEAYWSPQLASPVWARRVVS